jgi:hypothetical protein
MSNRFSGVGKVISALTIAFEDLEGRSIDFNDLVTVHIFNLWRFPAHG